MWPHHLLKGVKPLYNTACTQRNGSIQEYECGSSYITISGFVVYIVWSTMIYSIYILHSVCTVATLIPGFPPALPCVFLCCSLVLWWSTWSWWLDVNGSAESRMETGLLAFCHLAWWKSPCVEVAVSWCLFCRREYKVIVSVSSILKVSFCKGYIIWHVPSFNWLLLCNSPNHISCYYCMKEKSELTMCFVTHSRTISLHVPLGTIHDTVFNLACFQHKKLTVSSPNPQWPPLYVLT